MSTIVPSYDGSKKDTRLRHGMGRYTYQYAGFCYEGEWNEGVKHGNGVMSLPDGSLYEGDFLQGEMTGKGTREYPNGSLYTGDFFRGEHHGQGEFKYHDGTVYEGGWKEKQRSGKGKLIYANGDTFEGTFEKHHFHGLSKFTSHNGDKFQGDYSKGERNGHGIEILKACGSKYDGKWKNNLKSGYGSFELIEQNIQSPTDDINDDIRPENNDDKSIEKSIDENSNSKGSDNNDTNKDTNNKETNNSLFQGGRCEIRYQGEFGEGKALDASEYLDFVHTEAVSSSSSSSNKDQHNTGGGAKKESPPKDSNAHKDNKEAIPERIITGRGVLLPPISVHCFCKNRNYIEPQSIDGDSLQGHDKDHTTAVSAKDNHHHNHHDKDSEKVKKNEEEAEEEVELEFQRAKQESGRLLQLTCKPIKFKDNKLNTESAELLEKNIDLFLTRGDVGDAALGHMYSEPSIERLVWEAASLVPSSMNLGYMLGSVKSRHPGNALAKYQFPPTKDLDKALDEHRALCADRKLEADSDVKEITNSIGKAASEEYIKDALAKAKVDKVEVDMAEVELLAEQASIKAVAHALKKKGRFVLAGKVVLSDFIKSRRLFPIGQLDPRFMEKSVEMVLEEEDDDDDNDDKTNTNKKTRSQRSEEEDMNDNESNTTGGGSGAGGVGDTGVGEVGGVTCRVIEPLNGCWTGGNVIQPNSLTQNKATSPSFKTKSYKFSDAVTAAFQAQSIQGKQADAGACTLAFDFYLNPPSTSNVSQTSNTNMANSSATSSSSSSSSSNTSSSVPTTPTSTSSNQTNTIDGMLNKPFQIILLSSDIMEIKLISEPTLSQEDITLLNNNKMKLMKAKGRRNSAALNAKAEKLMKMKLEKSKLVKVKIVVTLMSSVTGHHETVILDADQMLTRLPPPPAPDSIEYSKLASQACTKYEKPPSLANMLPSVGGSVFGAWHSIAVVVNPTNEDGVDGGDRVSNGRSTSRDSFSGSSIDTNVLASLFMKQDENENKSQSSLKEPGCIYLNVCLDGGQLQPSQEDKSSQYDQHAAVACLNEVSPTAQHSSSISSNDMLVKTEKYQQDKSEQPCSSNNFNSEYGVCLPKMFKWCLTEYGGLKHAPNTAFTFMHSQSTNSHGNVFNYNNQSANQVVSYHGTPYGCGLCSFVIYDSILSLKEISKLSGCYAGFRAIEITNATDLSRQIENKLDEWRKEHPPKDPSLLKDEYLAKRERALQRLEVKKAQEEALLLKKNKGKPVKTENEKKKDEKNNKNDKKESDNGGENGSQHEDDEEDDEDDLLDDFNEDNDKKDNEDDELELSDDENDNLKEMKEPPLLPELFPKANINQSKETITSRGSTVFRGLILPKSTLPGEYQIKIQDITFDKLIGSTSSSTSTNAVGEDKRGSRMPKDTCGKLLKPLPSIYMTMVVPDSND